MDLYEFAKNIEGGMECLNEDQMLMLLVIVAVCFVIAFASSKK